MARIAVPVSLEMVFQLALGFVDQVIVGVLGAVAIASVGLANSVTFIGVLTLSTLGGGASILAARAFGAGDTRGVSRTTTVGLTVATLVAVLVSVVAALTAAPLLRLLSPDARVVEAALPYYGLVVASLPLVVIGAVASGVLRSLGHARTPMTVTMIAVVVNSVLAYLLVFGPGPLPALGLAGAAWATLAAQAFKAAALLGRLYGGRRHASWAPPRVLSEWVSVSRSLLTLTLPLTATELFWSVGTLLFTLLFARVGTDALAGVQIVNTIEGIFIVGSFGLMSAATSLIGQAVGGGNHQLALLRANVIVRTGLLTGVGFGVLFGLTAFALPTLYPRVGADVLAVAVWGIVINAVFQWAKVGNMIRGGGVLPSAGDTRGVLLGDVVGAFAVGLPLAWLLAFPLGLGVGGLFAARVLEELVKLAIFEVRSRRVRWHEVGAEVAAAHD
nr:MATE family efflux transporter [Deinococcus pimensis]